MSDGQELRKKNEPVFEPEPEPVPESKPVTTAHCQDDDDGDIEPLSGEPFFHKIITKSQVGNNCNYQLVVPAHFVHRLPNTTVPVSLTRGGRSWEMAYHGEKSIYGKKFDIRWKAFAEDNMLKIGDVCVFELMKCSNTALEFKVQVLRGDFPSVLLDKQNGTSNNPIVVD